MQSPRGAATGEDVSQLLLDLSEVAMPESLHEDRVDPLRTL